ncbi:hypothetical protein Taro_036222 [Colocasia esculenta]|uniref:C2H2-type domain-containing protein n=1 Tax=Colocasia esculenta TaxID=4460 RepID=A0A843WCR3_COLES|nr:hypothetical protein [Colocasia esculenta]
MHQAMTTLPGTSSPPAAPTNLTDHAMAAAGEQGRVPSRSCHRPRIRQLNAVTQLPSRPPPPLVRAAPAGAQRKRLSRSKREEAAKITQPCSECGKRFWSWKALFGHMRCHPDRPWRGIEPPPDCPRRGPDLAGPPADPASADEGGVSDAEVEAAISLVLLKGEQPEGSGSDELASPAQASGRFRCSSCDKVFDTPNGLGGHRAGHARWARDAVVARKRKMAEEGARRAVQVHKCGVCSMRFSSGQALGGHMSSHWKGESQLRVVVAAAEPASSFTSAACGCRFDLNLPAEEEREDVSFPSAFAIEPDRNLPPDGLHHEVLLFQQNPRQKN